MFAWKNPIEAEEDRLANRHLVKSGQHGFHGDLSLAKDLLALQQIGVVAKFFKLCHLHEEQELAKIDAKIERIRHASVDASVLNDALNLLEDSRSQLKIKIGRLQGWTEKIEKGTLLENEL